MAPLPDARLTHATRGTLPFRRRQRQESQRQAKANITSQLGVDAPSLVHTETRDETRTIRGLVTGLRRAENDPTTSDAVQALANYVDLLESHVDEFQGFDGYTFEDDLLGESLDCAIEEVQWTRQTGQPYDIEYEATVRIGRPTMGTEAIDRRNPTVKTGQDTMLVVDGEPCPGLRQYQVSREIGLEVKAIWNRETAENNDIVMEQGAEQRVSYEGTITGTQAQREAKDTALRDKLATEDPITLSTKFPGYDLDGFLIDYSSEQRTQHGERVHHYSLEFVEGTRA